MMATIAGHFSDAGLKPFTDRWPRLRFRPDRPGASGTSVLTTEPVDATITDSTGAFTVELVSTDEIVPAVTYTVIADWDAGGSLNVITGLRVPAGDWTLSELLINRGDAPPGTVLYGFGPPPAALSKVLYIDISGVKPVLYAPAGSGA